MITKNYFSLKSKNVVKFYVHIRKPYFFMPGHIYVVTHIVYRVTGGACQALYECSDVVNFLWIMDLLAREKSSKLCVVHVKYHTRVFIKFKLSGTIQYSMYSTARL